ncbi:peroxiredoxin [Actinomadura alba]
MVEDFELLDEEGRPRTLGGLLANGPVVLFFYPAALSRGCTVESCHFRDLAAEFAALGARPVGISTDPVSKQKRFADEHSLGYPLLSDTDGVVCARFGVKRGLALAPTKRQTFVIGTDRAVIEVIRSEIRMAVHADRALDALRRHHSAAG